MVAVVFYHSSKFLGKLPTCNDSFACYTILLTELWWLTGCLLVTLRVPIGNQLIKAGYK